MKTRQLVIVLATLALVAQSGCLGKSGQRGNAQDTTAALPKIAVDTEPIAARPAVSPDLALYPMPKKLPGQDRIAGPIVNQPHDWNEGVLGDLLFTSVNDTLVVTVCAVSINCCTERLAAGVTATAEGIDVMLFEYLPDVCECFHQRDIVFRLYPAPTAGQTLRVMANGRQKVLATQAVP